MYGVVFFLTLTLAFLKILGVDISMTMIMTPALVLVAFHFVVVFVMAFIWAVGFLSAKALGYNPRIVVRRRRNES